MRYSYAGRVRALLWAALGGVAGVNTAASMMELYAQRDRLRKLMAEAVRDFHGKSVLFSAEFLEEAGKHEPSKSVVSKTETTDGH